MFNVTVIRLKDVIRIILFVSIFYFFANFMIKNVQVKTFVGQKIDIVNTNKIRNLGLGVESCLFRYVLADGEAENLKTEEAESEIKNISAKKIIAIGSKLFKIKEKETKFGQESSEIQQEPQNTNTNSEEQKIAQTQDIATDTNTQVVTQNPIVERYNREYNGIKIRNETSYELTDDMLNPENLDIDKKDIIIFHTHTCESYTQTENYQYEPSRKLQNNKSKFFCCACWR